VKRILLVDDDPDLLEALARNFRSCRHEWQVSTAQDGRRATQLVQEGSFDLVITDILMPEKEGLETILELRRDHPEVKVIAMSGGGRRIHLDVLGIARSFGAHRVIEKPFDATTLIEVVRSLFAESDHDLPSLAEEPS
jgi:DNA-binding response OmpR family regulator